MMLAGIALSFAMSATSVPPGNLVEDHTQPYHWDQPVLRRFERHEDDYDRRLAWNAYVRQQSDLWREYRKAGATPQAWRKFKRAAAQAKRRYVYGDIYLAPIVHPLYEKP